MSEYELVLPTTLPTNEQDLNTLGKRLSLIREFIKSQLKEGIDFGVVPGTNKKSLWKPGAQKGRMLFGCSVTVDRTERTLDRPGNIYTTSYKAKVIHLATGNVIAECEGSCSNLEKKYFKRKVWKYLPGGGKEQTEEETPIGDLINTIDKMAQKRAIVGATIEALGISDDFTQDLDDETEQEQAGLRPNTDQIKRNADENGNVTIPNCNTDKCEWNGKPMLISKFVNKETGKYGYYCGKCKAKKDI